jgi:hypothetical protein
LDVPELVDAEQLAAPVAGDDPGEASIVGGFSECVDEWCGGGVVELVVLFAGGDPETDEWVAFARAGVAPRRRNSE